MSRIVITVTKQEVEQAVLDYVNSNITVQGRKKLEAPSLFFSNKDGTIGYFDCMVEADSLSGEHTASQQASPGPSPTSSGPFMEEWEE